MSVGFAAMFASATPSQGDETSEEIKTLKAQIESLAQKVHALERKRELDQAVVAEKAQLAEEKADAAPIVTAGPSGFSLQSADGNFVIGFHGVMQLDSRTFINENPKSIGKDTFLLRRARPILSGTVFHDFEFMFVPDFGGSTTQIFDAYMNYRNRPELQLQVGKFKSPVGLEHLQADVNTTFNERSMATDLVPNRDIGAEVHGDLYGAAFSYAVGIFIGAPDYSGTTTNADYDNNKAFAGRVFLQPFRPTAIRALRGLGLGVGGSYENDQASSNTALNGLTPGLLTDGQQIFFSYSSNVFASGPHWRVAPQGYYYYGPLSLLAEYVVDDQEVMKIANNPLIADLQNRAWEITAGWVLTGEEASYNGVTPEYPFDLRTGHWGALQLVARVSELRVDKDAFPVFASVATSASAAHEWALGLNWYLNRNVRVNVSGSRTTFDGGNGAQAIVTRQSEEVIFTRVQLGF